MFGRKKQQVLLAQLQRDLRAVDLQQARMLANQLNEPLRSRRLAQIEQAERRLRGTNSSKVKGV